MLSELFTPTQTTCPKCKAGVLYRHGRLIACACGHYEVQPPPMEVREFTGEAMSEMLKSTADAA